LEPKSVTTAKFLPVQYFTKDSGADAEPQADNLQAVTHNLQFTHYEVLTGHHAA